MLLICMGRKIKPLAAERLRRIFFPVFSALDDCNLRHCCTQSINFARDCATCVICNAHHTSSNSFAHFAHCSPDSAKQWSGIAARINSPMIGGCKLHCTYDTRSAETAVHDVSMVDMDKGSGIAFNVSSLIFGTPESERQSIDKCVESINDMAVGTTNVISSIEDRWDKDSMNKTLDVSDSSMNVKQGRESIQLNPEVGSMNSQLATTVLQDKAVCTNKCKELVENSLLASSTRSDEFMLDLPQSTGIKREQNEDTRYEASHNAGDFEAEAACFANRSSELDESQNVKTLEEDIFNYVYDETTFDAPPEFSQQQMEVLEAIACGKSVFITGSAGTGKSVLLKYIIGILENTLGTNSVQVTASTGVAAIALNGATLHAFAGIYGNDRSAISIARRILSNKEQRKRWREITVLVVDEISMIDGLLFDVIEFVARRVRHSTEVFGGIQLIVSGDFFQLPPVIKSNLQKTFAFQADCWSTCFHMQVELEHVFRQSDSMFVKMLNEIRKGVYSSETIQKLDLCQRALPDDGTGIFPTRLYPLRRDVSNENLRQLLELETSIKTFSAVDSVPKSWKLLNGHVRLEKQLKLCVGAQVMLTKNLDWKTGLVNGAKGVVTGFQSQFDRFEVHYAIEKDLKHASHLISPSGFWPIVRFKFATKAMGPSRDSVINGGKEVASRIQIPLILAWALSIHKCQGLTLSKVQTDLSKAFGYGMVYVALSRVKDLDGLELISYNPSSIRAHPKVLEFCNRMAKNTLESKQEGEMTLT